MPSRPAPSLAGLLLLALPAATAFAADVRFGLEARSEMVHRGFAYADQRPAGVVTGSADWDNGIFVGGDVFSATGSDEPSLESGSSWYVGWFQPTAAESAFALSVRRYLFDSGVGPQWNFDEWRADWHASKSVTLSMSFSDDYYGRRSPVWLPEIAVATDLSETLSLGADVGFAVATQDSMFDDTWYARAGITRAFSRFHVALDVFAADTDIRHRTGFADPAGTRVVLSVGASY